ncbi:MAG TPA: NAD(P)H-binding protein [Pseudonocardiaceae bacterium]|jgi:uncharacterized protein YbjT (DUF2867 family)
MTTPILVIGGTGTLGQLVVPRLRIAGEPVRVLTRGRHENTDGVEFVTGDLATGEGIDAAVAGVRTIVHCAGSAKGDEEKARNLVRAAVPAGVRHLVYISVVGADRIPVDSRIDRAMYGYFAAKLAAERIVAASGVPFTTLRTTQFHDFVLTMAKQVAKLPVIPALRGARCQPIDAADVADRLTALALGEPAGLVPDMGGPTTYSMTDLITDYLTATHRHRRPIVSFRPPGKAAGAFLAGANLAPDHAVGLRTWEDFLAERVA